MKLNKIMLLTMALMAGSSQARWSEKIVYKIQNDDAASIVIGAVMVAVAADVWHSIKKSNEFYKQIKARRIIANNALLEFKLQEDSRFERLYRYLSHKINDTGDYIVTTDLDQKGGYTYRDAVSIVEQIKTDVTLRKQQIEFLLDFDIPKSAKVCIYGSILEHEYSSLEELQKNLILKQQLLNYIDSLYIGTDFWFYETISLHAFSRHASLEQLQVMAIGYSSKKELIELLKSFNFEESVQLDFYNKILNREYGSYETKEALHAEFAFKKSLFDILNSQENTPASYELFKKRIMQNKYMSVSQLKQELAGYKI